MTYNTRIDARIRKSNEVITLQSLYSTFIAFLLESFQEG